MSNIVTVKKLQEQYAARQDRILHKIKEHSYLGRLSTTYAAALEGNWRAQTAIKNEAMSTSDFPAAFVVVNQARLLGNLAEYEPMWPAIATREVVDNLLPARTMRLQDDETGAGTLATNGGYARIPGTLSRIPELTEYPTLAFTASGAEIATAKVGVRVEFSWEMFKNDQWRQLEQIPDFMGDQAVNTEETEPLRKYFNAGGFNGATDGMFPASSWIGTVATVANPPLSITSLEAALAIAKRKPATPSGLTPRRNTQSKWALLVPTALKATADAITASMQIERTLVDGSKVLQANPVGGGSIVPVEVPWLDNGLTTAGYLTGVSATGWALVPYGGLGIYGPTVSNVYLRGLESPEFRIKADQGQSLGGGSLGPYDGSFEVDDTQLRMRMFVAGATQNIYGTVYSKGSGTGTA